MNLERYSRQMALPGIGKEGQKKLAAGSAVIVGCGALGTVIATNLVRAGLGRVVLLDRDYVELTNLQRQVLFTEDDVREQLPKAVAAARHLRAINSEVVVEGHVVDVNPNNINKYIKGADVVLDGTDNFITRFLVNDAILKHRVPFIQGAALGGTGMTMAVVPGETPCYRCVVGEMPPPGRVATCERAGVLGSVTGVIGAVEACEAIKLLVGEPVTRGLLYVDLWSGDFERVEIEKDPHCPACHGDYQYLEGALAFDSQLCGQQAVQVSPPQETTLDLDKLAETLEGHGRVYQNKFLLRFEAEGVQLVVFPDGRALVKNVEGIGQARSLYARYIGT